MSDNLADLLKTFFIACVPTVALLAKMWMTERSKHKERLEERQVRLEEREEDQRKAAAIAAAVSEVAVKAEKSVVAAKEVVTTAAETKVEMVEKLDQIVKVSEEIQKVGVASHILVNRNMGIKLQELAMALAVVFEKSGTKVDKDALEKALADHESHMNQQGMVDEMENHDHAKETRKNPIAK